MLSQHKTKSSSHYSNILRGPSFISSYNSSAGKNDQQFQDNNEHAPKRDKAQCPSAW